MPSTSPKQHRNQGDSAAECPHCGGPRVWKHAKAGGSSWRQYCTACHSRNSYNSRKARRSEYLAQIKDRRINEPAFRAYELWHGAKCRASSRGIEFSLPRADVERWMAVGICQVTGLRFDLALKSKRMGSFSPSLDRIDPNKGYIPGNVRMVCWIYNRAKGDGTDSDVMMLVEALNAVRKSQAA